MNKAMSFLKPSSVVSLSLEDSAGHPLQLSYVWQPSDAGRSASRRPRQTNDCTVRALATVMGSSYDEAYEELKRAGRKCRSGFRLSDWLGAQAWATKIAFPAVKGQKRMNPSSFVKTFPAGRYIVKVSHHVFACIDGIVHDETVVSPDRCIYTAWKVTR